MYQVPSSQFVFGQSSSGAPDLIVTSSNSGLQSQEAMDRTALDMAVFARGGAEAGVSVSGEAGDDEGIDIDESEEEAGVSSISSSSEQAASASGGNRPRVTRNTITWDEQGSSTGTTSSSPGRQAQVRRTIHDNSYHEDQIETETTLETLQARQLWHLSLSIEPSFYIILYNTHSLLSAGKTTQRSSERASQRKSQRNAEQKRTIN